MLVISEKEIDLSSLAVLYCNKDAQEQTPPNRERKTTTENYRLD